MTGIFIKAGFTCTACEGFIPLNALIHTISCPACREEFELDEKVWSTVLEDVIRKAPYLEEGEGRGSTVFGRFNMKLETGRVQPRYRGTKKSISTEDIIEGLDRGYVEYPDTGERTGVRSYSGFCLKLFPGIRAVIGEDRSLLPGTEEGLELNDEGEGNPVALQCPNCGGSLIVSGRRRKEKCGYCGSSAQLPDDLWNRLHPAKKMLRWYLLYDFDSVPFLWEEYVLDAVPLNGGDICAAFHNPNSDLPMLVRLDREGKRVWIRHDLDFQCGRDDDGTGITFDGERILFKSGEGRDLAAVSALDGSNAKGMPELGIEETETGEKKMVWDMESVRSMTCLQDGSLVLHKDYEDDRYCHTELVRLDPEGKRIPLWDHDEPKKETGFFAKLLRVFTSRRGVTVTALENSGDRPVRITDSYIELVSNNAGTLFALSGSDLMAYQRDGSMKYRVKLPCRWIHGRPAPGREGLVYILGEEDNQYLILAVSPEGETSVFCDSISSMDASKVFEGVEDSEDEDFDVLVRGSDGTLHAMGYDGAWIRLGTVNLNTEASMADTD